MSEAFDAHPLVVLARVNVALEVIYEQAVCDLGAGTRARSLVGPDQYTYSSWANQEGA